MKKARRNSMQKLVLAAALSAGLGLGFSSSVFAQETHSYIVDLNSKTIINLGPDINVYAINDAGQVAGALYPAPDTAPSLSHAFFSGPNGGGKTDLGTLDERTSYATGINAAGQVVGQALTPESGPFPVHGFITGPNGVGITQIGTMHTSPNGVNATGQVVGSFDATPDVSHAFITGPNGVGMTDLGTLGGSQSNSTAIAINDTGRVGGSFDAPRMYPMLSSRARTA
jgi:probable HAF family extracellular repeat protein